MIDAGSYRVEDQLKNGTAAIIRAIRPDDKGRIVEAFRNLESESVYTRFFRHNRFFRHKSELTDAELKTITEEDYQGQGLPAEY